MGTTTAWKNAPGFVGTVTLAACWLAACSGKVIVENATGGAGGAGGEPSSTASWGVSVASVSASGTGGAPSTTVVSSSSFSGPASSSAATGTMVTSTGTTPGGANLAAPCGSDAECGPAGRCMLPAANEPTLGGGPAGGYCTKNCNTDADCPGPGSACRTDPNGTNGACFLGCTIGPPIQYLDDPLDPFKCHGRSDLRCQTYDMGNTVLCMPTCGSDVDCPAGRACDPRLTVCVDIPSMGSRMGEACDPLNPMCAGTCFSFTGGETMCSSHCSLGGEIIGATDCGGLDRGLCVFSPQGHGPGDFGVCAEACKAHDECQVPAFWCYAINGLTGPVTDNGWCIGVSQCTTQADCMHGTCTDTKFGKYCIDTQFPLGTAAP